MNNTVIKVENLSKLYHLGELHRQTHSIRDRVTGFFKRNDDPKKAETIWALKDVSFEVKEGEILGIIGPNGAGKSTLLKILSRITKPTHGNARINGRVGSLLEVGTGFHPELTGRENIYLNGAVLGMKKSEIKQKFAEIVAFAEIEKFLDTPVKRYSSGMYVRLAFAVAAHLEPEILLVDEVLAVGDAAFQKKCLGKMENVSTKGRTIVFVSHNMGAITGLCERAIWLNNGVIEADGNSKDTVSHYLSSAVNRPLQSTRKTGFDSQDMEIERVVLKDEQGEITTNFKHGSDITIEIQYHAFKRIPKPYFWIGIGSLFGANMLLDGLRPDHIDGKGTISCTFKGLNLFPQSYSVNVGARNQNGVELLVPTIKDAAVINVIGRAQDFGMKGDIADSLIGFSGGGLLVPYEWHFMDGRVAVPKWAKGDR